MSLSCLSTSTITVLLKQPLHTAIRCASVLASMPPTPLSGQPQQQPTTSPLPTHEHIVTPASSPLTTPSNNAFHPDYIPNRVKARLTHDELKQVLDTSKMLLNRLQSEYLEQEGLKDSIAQMAKEQQELLKILTRNRELLGDDDGKKK
ncbi:hypothetical protein O0I10_002444 [Lichtheimia ornata]|uniref:Uncharacterized protein n=1 Tax=Lichtheimia ornata TaxID=688661 RepID=A0AAD7VBX4_9FUNG|nr:uncharacterized protein O0I10_002444 [Lichtheimia ornata]KAJ8661637.1 hypothetical protein O0I10_002444 [Lichtheimia ornata]